MVKVIQILHHSLSPFKLDVDPKFYEGDWHVRVGKKIKKAMDKYEVECWRPEKSFDNVYNRTGEDGIKYRIFPSTYFNSKFEYSLPLLREFKKEVEKEKVLLHFHGIYNFHTYLLLSLVGKKVPVVAQSHGGLPALLQFRKSSHSLRFLYLLEFIPQRVSFRNVDQFFCLNDEEKKILSKFGRSEVQPMGIDFDRFVPMSKKKCS